MPGKNYFDSIVNYWRVYAGIDDESAKKCEKFLKKIINTKDYPLTRLSDTTSSETAKVLENSYRAANIAFIEEWGRFAEDIGIDIFEIIESIRMRPTHSNIRQPGFGVGGYCLTKDPIFAKIAAKEIFKLNGHEFEFSTMSIKTNDKMPLVTLKKISDYFDGQLNNKKILLMGATYRQDIADTRFSPSEIFYKESIKIGAKVDVYDPLINYWKEVDIKTYDKLPESLRYDVIVFAVPHTEFFEISMSSWITRKDILIFDANNVLKSDQTSDIKNNNLNYISIGRG